MAVSPTDGSKPCTECRQPCISLCPYCKEHVHHGYGLHNDNCSGRHEEKCSGARWARDSERSKST